MEPTRDDIPSPAEATVEVTPIPDDLVGRELGGCRLTRKLGQGGMGAVYRATHLALEKTVAVKILNPARFYDQKKVDQFFVEARSAASIEHQNIVGVHDVGQDQGLYYIIMQFVEGESLSERLARERILPPREAARIAREVARGLGVAHEKDIIHRDIKPGNVMLTADGGVKIADFGLALRVSPDDDLTAGLGIMGTPAYMSPEQVDGGQVDHRADLYALGVMLYRMTTGRKPYTGDNPMEVLIKHVQERARPPAELNPDLDREFSQVIERLMSKSPANRYPDAASLMVDLEQVIEGGKPKVVVAVEDVLHRMEELAKKEFREPRQRKHWFAAVSSGISAAVCVLLLTVGLPDVAARRSDGATEPPTANLEAAEQAFRALVALSRDHPSRIREIREAAHALEDEYPPPYPSRAGAVVRESELAFEKLCRAETAEFLKRSARFRQQDLLPEALLVLYEIPEVWLADKVGLEIAASRKRLQADLTERAGAALVPGGTFPAGPDRHEEHVLPFLVDLREVSNAEYETFVRKTGHRSPSYWIDDRSPADDRDLPVVGVSFEDARAYAEWAGKRLPTEQEWEKAARGTDGRIWPWGDEFQRSAVNCQGFEKGLRSARGYPGGASPWGCLNMAGNAHEWTTTRGDGADTRIVRGGAWASHLSNTRTWSRIGVDAATRDPALAIGFRCVADVSEDR